MQPKRRPFVLRLRWLVALLLLSSATVVTVHLVNHYLHRAYVTFEGPKQSLRLLTWNVGRIYMRWDSRASDADLEHVARMIRETRPQIVALQEIRDATQLGRLVTALGPRWRGKVPEDAYDRRAALLLRLRATFFELPTSSGRTAQGAVVRLPGGRRATVVSLHLDAFDPERRLHQAEEIVAGARRLGHDNLILAGDFNFDVAVSERDSIDHRLYRFLSRELTDAATSAGGTTLIARRLDYVFFSGSSRAVVDSRVLRDRNIHSMDHHPLVVELDLDRR